MEVELPAPAESAQVWAEPSHLWVRVRVNPQGHRSQTQTARPVTSPEMEAGLGDSWRGPAPARSGGGVARPQRREGLHVTSSA